MKLKFAYHGQLFWLDTTSPRGVSLRRATNWGGDPETIDDSYIIWEVVWQQ